MEFIGQALQGVHVGTLTEEMHWKHGGEFVGLTPAQEAMYLSGIEIKSLRVDIDENWLRAGSDDSARRGKEAERRGKNLVARLNPTRNERQPQGVSTRGASDGFWGTAEICNFAFEGFDLGSQNVMLGGANSLHGSQNFWPQVFVLAAQVKHGNGIE